MATPAVRPADASQNAGWLELFYDLVFVVVVAQVTHLVHGDPDGRTMLAAFGLLLAVWMTWFNEVSSTNVAGGISARRRVFVLASMAGAGVMAVGVADLGHGDPRTFGVGYALTRSAMAPVWVAERRRHGLGILRPIAFGPGFGLCWAVSAFVPVHYWQLWLVLALAEMAMMGAHRFGNPLMPYDAGHMLERIGSFVMICFGEAVAQVAGALTDDHRSGHWVAAALGFVLVAAMFWQFYDLALDHVEHALAGAPDRVGDFLGMSQIVVVAGILGVSAGVSEAVTVGAGGHLASSALAVLAGGLALFLLGVASLSGGALRLLAESAGLLPAGGTRTSGWRERHRRRRERRRDRSERRASGDWPASRTDLPERPAGGLLAALGMLAVRGVLVPLLVLVEGGRLPVWAVLLLLVAAPVASILLDRMTPDRMGPAASAAGRPPSAQAD